MQADIDEALRLIRMSKVSLFEDENNDAALDPISAIYTAIRDNAVLTGKQSYLWSELVTLLGRMYTVCCHPPLNPIAFFEDLRGSQSDCGPVACRASKLGRLLRSTETTTCSRWTTRAPMSRLCTLSSRLRSCPEFFQVLAVGLLSRAQVYNSLAVCTVSFGEPNV